jgi:type IV pilus assembly protein PilM
VAHRIVGLDIGTSAVRAVELEASEGARPVLLAYGQVGLPPGAVVDGEIRDHSRVVQSIQRLWKEGGFGERQVHLGIVGLRAIIREIDMPPLPLAELDDAVLYQADQIIPFPLERTAISAKVIARFTDADGSPQIRVLVAAAHRDLIDGVVGAVQGAGLEPVSIDLDTDALARALNDPAFTGGSEAIVSVGAGLTMVVIHQGGLLQFVRTIDIGGQTVTEAIAGALDLPILDAEEVKRHLDRPGAHDRRAESVTSTVVADLVSEVHNSVRFFSSQPGRAAPTRLLVTGGGSQTVGFLAKLQQGIDIPVLPASPLSLVDTSKLPITDQEAAAINRTLAVPVGLALPDRSERPFNLLPAEVTARQAERRLRNVLVACGVVLLLLMIGGTLWRVLAVRSADHRVSALNAQLTHINSVTIPKYDKVVSLQQKVRTLQAQDKPLVAGQVDWLVVLNQLSQYMPSTAVFSTLDLTGSDIPGTAPVTPAAGVTPGSAPIGTGTAGVVVSNLTQFSQFGNSMSTSPAITLGQPTGTLDNSSSITFDITFSIDSAAHSQRTGLFTQVVP